MAGTGLDGTNYEDIECSTVGDFDVFCFWEVIDHATEIERSSDTRRRHLLHPNRKNSHVNFVSCRSDDSGTES